MKNKLLIISFHSPNLTSPLLSIISTFSNYRTLYQNTWIVATNESAASIFKQLEPHFDRNTEKVFIAEINDNTEGWISREIWDWMKALNK